MSLHSSTFSYLLPNDDQKVKMERLREAVKVYAKVIEADIQDGPDKTYIFRRLREIAMWVNVAITRCADGTPRTDREP